MDFTGCLVEVIQLKHSIEGTNIAFIHVFLYLQYVDQLELQRKMIK